MESSQAQLPLLVQAQLHEGLPRVQVHDSSLLNGLLVLAWLKNSDSSNPQPLCGLSHICKCMPPASSSAWEWCLICGDISFPPHEGHTESDCRDPRPAAN